MPCVLQMLAAMADSDDDLEGLEGPSSDEKPAGRRSKKAKKNEDSDFEVRCGCADCWTRATTVCWCRMRLARHRGLRCRAGQYACNAKAGVS